MKGTEKKKPNAVVECCTSPSCAICYMIWSCIGIFTLIIIGLLEGVGEYQKLNGELLTEEELKNIMDGAFLACGFYGGCILLCGINLGFAMMKQKREAQQTYTPVV
eukprot:TRINITY_DN664_c0_g1_i3.p1 TRINITY_DN664_c0_g1~~TRINITY_DN664_c0_g1_i3.p1  ORF type:complete len:106 (-),score=17.07 TRINITY_DN664_c0_g1_i3:122-439(-)